MRKKLTNVGEILFLFIFLLGSAYEPQEEVVQVKPSKTYVEDISNYDLHIEEVDTEVVKASCEEEVIEEPTEEFIIPDYSDDDFSQGFTSAEANIRTLPSMDSDVYAVYGFNSCISYAPYNDEWAAMKYYNRETQGIVIAFINTSLISDTEFIYSPAEYESNDFRSAGVIYYEGHKWTWYSQNVLPGGGLSIPGRHLDDMGYVCDENDRIVLASCDYSKGTIINTPLGKEGCVYDYCPTSGTLDVYVGW